MPIEIRELIIKAKVKESSSSAPAGSNGSAVDKEAIVQDCVEQVLEILEKRSER